MSFEEHIFEIKHKVEMLKIDEEAHEQDRTIGEFMNKIKNMDNLIKCLEELKSNIKIDTFHINLCTNNRRLKKK